MTSSRLQRLTDTLRRYFLVEGSPTPLALFRIGLGFTTAYEATHNFKRIVYYTPQTFHFPYVDFIKPLPITFARTTPADQLVTTALQSLTFPIDSIEVLFGWQLVFGVLVCAGLLTRLSTLGVLLTQGYALFICQLNFRNHVYLTLLLFLVLLFAPSNKTLSLDSTLRAFWRVFVTPDSKASSDDTDTAETSPKTPPKTPKIWVPLLTQRLIGLQICMVYFWATLHKIQPGFLSGYPLGKAASRAVRKAVFMRDYFPSYAQPLSDLFADPTWQPLFAIMTVFTEGFLALGLLFRPTRLMAVILGIGLHFSIFAMMDIHTFGLLMVFGYICFWTPRTRPMSFEGLPDLPPITPPPQEAPDDAPETETAPQAE